MPETDPIADLLARVAEEHREDAAYPETCVCEVSIADDAPESHYARHLAEVQAAALRDAGYVVEGSEVEERWVPICESGERWFPRTKAQAEEAASDYPAGGKWANGDSWDGITHIVHERRTVTPWLEAKEGDDGNE